MTPFGWPARLAPAVMLVVLAWGTAACAQTGAGAPAAGGTPATAADAATVAGALAYTRCLRDHGVEVADPAFQAGTEACRHTLAGGRR